MRKIQIALMMVFGLLAGRFSYADATWEYSVQVSATVQASPAKITLSWPQDTTGTPNSYTIYRKTVDATSWGTGTTLPGNQTTYTDSNVAAGSAYEYQIVKAMPTYTGYGYIYAGINAPAIESRGKLVLLVDNTYASQLTNELATLQQDLVGDGWTVLRHDVSRTDTPPNIKSIIQSEYNADPANVNAVFLFGHVPVPYSGDLAPDGHVPNHVGAWPADVYYGNMHGVWTDSSVNDSGADYSRNWNVPGDGKFDQTTIPGAVELMVGRVDLANLPGELVWNGPATWPNELALLRNYLNKDHKFRQNQMNLPRRGIVGDYFGSRNGEAFAASGWRNFAPFFGASNIVNLPNQGTWIPTLAANGYLWSYACGAGSFSSMGGIGNSDAYNDGYSTEVYSNNIQSVFTLFFGSWMGDWDSQDNIMRTVLALPTYGLACAWSGRPHWFMHHMALGEPIGYSARLTQNNGPSGLYQNQINTAAGDIHVALMGDPTLRMHPVTPASNVTAKTNSSSVSLTWNASTDSSIVGYNIYRASNVNGPFTRLNSSPVTGASYTDSTANGGAYMVRAVKLETSGSGTYYNPSQGAFANVGALSITSTNSGSTTSTNTSASGANGAGATTSASNPAGWTNFVNWVDDAIPAGATPGSDGGDSWTWVTSNPAPFTGAQASQSAIATGEHQHFFTGATSALNVNTGDVLAAYVYLDPANPPTEVMLQWYVNNWEHRAYWGADSVTFGAGGTTNHYHAGALPATGQWVPLYVPASQVGLEGATVNGMAFTLYNGRATFDTAGKGNILQLTTSTNGGSGITSTNTGSGTITSTNSGSSTGTNTASLGSGTSTNSTTVTSTNSGSSGSNTVTTTTTTNLNSFVKWVDDAVPAGAQSGADGGDAWNWVGSNPAPYSGALANQSTIATGEHQHYFIYANGPLAVNSGDTLVAYVYLDPANPPAEVMLQWYVNNWEHRAYWGADSVTFGAGGTTNHYYMGALPATGQWVPLYVPASQVGLAGASVNGMAFSLYNGRATFDAAGKGTLTVVTSTNSVASTNTGSGSITSTNTGSASNPLASLTNFVNWVDDTLPTGATPGTDGGDSWLWVSNNPTALSGAVANQSAIATGEHQHFFTGATSALNVNTGDIMLAYVYLDPANPPTEVMLQWYVNNWEHRAYWGADSVTFGAGGTTNHYHAGALPATGQWVPLYVPASQVGLEGSTVSGMAFTLYGGRATFDAAGKGSLAQYTTSTNSTGTNSGTGGITSTNTGPGSTNSSGTGTTNTSGGSTNVTTTYTNSSATIMGMTDDTTLRMPSVGDNELHIVSPNTLELTLITAKQPDPATVTQWSFVDANGNLTPPASGKFNVTVNGKAVAVSAIGFKRRVLYAPLLTYDLRIENSLYLQLGSSVPANATVAVQNPDGTLWANTMQFTNTANALRYSPAIHVNQEGYVPSLPKKAMVGYYLGNLGEMSIPANTAFSIVDANTGAAVYQGTLMPRQDVGWTYSATPYQAVMQADFSGFTTPGEYQLVVPGYGASLPFLINDGIAMDFARAYALGLYEQRCGTNLAMPYTRFTHGVCHAGPASVPLPESSYAFTWKTIAGYSGGNTTQTAPQLINNATSLFPFVNTGTVNTIGGHHDAGDYSKYTINVATLTHYLCFAVDSLAGVSNLDNLGIPESGDGIPDVLQEAKWEADYLARLQDADGGFYFIVYPTIREYEGNVTPDHGDPQVVWPKNTACSAAATAALAQCASSPMFKKYYPNEAAAYLQKAKLGWQFLTNAIAKYGKTGAYQKITFYGDDFNDADELAWAACQMYLATGDQTAHKDLLAWFDPSDTATMRWGWWHMTECYGHAIRSYAFAVQSGRVASASQLDATFLAKCQAEIAAAGTNAVAWSQQSAYGTSFPSETKAVQGAGWYFSDDFGFDMAVAYQLNPQTNYLDAIVANMNYEGGCNPINVSYVTGLGWKRNRTIVSQFALNDGLTLPPSGMCSGNIQTYAPYVGYPSYGGELEELAYPSDTATASPYPFYDRWSDTWNVTTELVSLNLGRGLADLAFLGTLTSTKSQPYVAKAGTITVPTKYASDGTLTFTFTPPAGMDMNGARVVWEAQYQEPAFGPTYTFTPKYSGQQYVHAEAQWPDGRRAFATNSFSANAPFVVWLEDSMLAGATASADGGDSWNWVSSNPTPYAGSAAHQSAIASGEHQHYFYGATGTMTISAGDVMFAYVYIDPANPPTEVMLQWYDSTGSWEHRAYWGANTLGYGTDGSTSRYNASALPASGQWVQLAVPASKVGLEGATVSGMSFTLYGGRATWDHTGKASAGTTIK